MSNPRLASDFRDAGRPQQRGGRPDAPGWLLALVLVYGVLWVWHLSAVALSAPMDSIVQLVWSHSAQWGYYKHPPLPTWLLLPLVRLLGEHALVPAVLGATFTLVSVAVFHALLRRIWGPSQAFVGVLLALSITFYNGRLNFYNHNTLLLLAVSLTVYFWWRILEDGRTRWWLGLGVSAGIGLMSKYQYVVVLVPSLYGLFVVKPWRSVSAMLKPLLALLLAMGIFAPHLVWLWTGHLLDNPIQYALKVSRPDVLQQWSEAARWHSGIWLIDLVFNRCLPVIVSLLLFRLVLWRAPGQTGGWSRGRGPAELPRQRFLLVWSTVPALTITLLGLLLGMNLQMQWGTAFALWMVPGFMWLGRMHRMQLSPRACWRVLAVFLLIQALLMFQSYRTSPAGCCTQHNRWRAFDSPAIARELDQAARAAAGGRFRILVGPTAPAGAISLALPDRPRVLIDGNEAISPWIEHEALRGPGVVEIFAPGQSPSDARLLPSGWGWRLYTPAR